MLGGKALDLLSISTALKFVLTGSYIYIMNFSHFHPKPLPLPVDMLLH